MPVIVDATALTSVARGSGIGTYTRGLLEALGRRDDVSVRALATASASLPAGISLRRVRRMFHRPRAEVMEHALLMPSDLGMARRADAGVFHNPGFHAPWGVKEPWVQSLHDVIPLVLEDPDVAVLRERWKRFRGRYQAASAVIAVSDYSAQEGVRVLGLDPARVHVVHHGVNPACGPANDWPADPPYLLVVGEYARRKGFDRAFAVIDALADAGYPHTLKVAGTVHEWAREELHALRDAALHPERVAILGHVDDLFALYQGAHAYLSTSRYEGFGLPALEAMACGAPVVAFANTAVTEVVGSGGALVPDGDVEAMVLAIRVLLDSPAAAEDWRQRGLARAAGFTWDAAAAAHADVYREVWGR